MCGTGSLCYPRDEPALVLRDADICALRNTLRLEDFERFLHICETAARGSDGSQQICVDVMKPLNDPGGLTDQMSLGGFQEKVTEATFKALASTQQGPNSWSTITQGF